MEFSNLMCNEKEEKNEINSVIKYEKQFHFKKNI